MSHEQENPAAKAAIGVCETLEGIKPLPQAGKERIRKVVDVVGTRTGAIGRIIGYFEYAFAVLNILRKLPEQCGQAVDQSTAKARQCAQDILHSDLMDAKTDLKQMAAETKIGLAEAIKEAAKQAADQAARAHGAKTMIRWICGMAAIIAITLALSIGYAYRLGRDDGIEIGIAQTRNAKADLRETSGFGNTPLGRKAAEMKKNGTLTLQALEWLESDNGKLVYDMRGKLSPAWLGFIDSQEGKKALALQESGRLAGRLEFNETRLGQIIGRYVNDDGGADTLLTVLQCDKPGWKINTSKDKKTKYCFPVSGYDGKNKGYGFFRLPGGIGEE